MLEILGFACCSFFCCVFQKLTRKLTQVTFYGVNLLNDVQKAIRYPPTDILSMSKLAVSHALDLIVHC